MPLTQQQTEELSGLINGRREALAAEIHADVAKARCEPFSDLAGAARDSGDESVAALIQDLDQAEVSRDLNELRALEAASHRIEDGSYGLCADCGSDIDFARLRANPPAARCLRCQELFEKTHAGSARPSL